MFKGRLILGAILAALVICMIALWQNETIFSLTGKWALTGVGIFFYLNTCIVLAINLFALDEQGRIPKGSLAWRYFDLMSETSKKTESGKWVKKSTLQDHMNLCLMYRTVALGFFVLIICGTIALGALPAAGFGVFIAVSRGHTTELLSIAGYAVAGITLGGALIWLLVQLYGKLGSVGRKYFWIFLGFFALTSIASAVYIGAPHAAEFGPTSENARTEGALEIGKGVGMMIGTFIAAIAAIIVLFISWALAARFVSLSWIKNSLIVKMISTLYHNFCTVIPIEMVEPSQETTK